MVHWERLIYLKQNEFDGVFYNLLCHSWIKSTCTLVLWKVLVLVLKYFDEKRTCICTCTSKLTKYLYLSTFQCT